jgi:hypothetical protein
MLLPSSEAEYPAFCDRVAKYNAVYSHLDAFAHSSTIGFKMYATPRESTRLPSDKPQKTGVEVLAPTLHAGIAVGVIVAYRQKPAQTEVYLPAADSPGSLVLVRLRCCRLHDRRPRGRTQMRGVTRRRIKAEE